jgi:hypothetical protein
MTIVLLAGGLSFAVGLLVLRPFAPARVGQPAARTGVRAPDPAADESRELLRQLRDLDDDLAAGKLTTDDHERLRTPVERAAVAVLSSAASSDTQARATKGKLRTNVRSHGFAPPAAGSDTKVRAAKDSSLTNVRSQDAALPAAGSDTKARAPKGKPRTNVRSHDPAPPAAAGSHTQTHAAEGRSLTNVRSQDAPHPGVLAKVRRSAGERTFVRGGRSVGAAEDGAAENRAAQDGATEPAGAVAAARLAGPPPDSGGVRAMGRWRRRSAILLVLVGASAGVAVLLSHAISPRTAGETISGTAVPGAALASPAPASPVPASPAPVTSPAPGPAASAGAASGAQKTSPAPGASPSAKPPTRQELAAVAEAEAVVKQNPGSVSAHLTLASAYVAAGASQLAAVEWLAVTQLDPGNTEANTDLALLAFEVGRAKQARTMVDRALATNPKYPEGLYVRGLIDLMGLRQPAAAVRDLNAYLDVAPFGSHRTDAVTLIALAEVQNQAPGQGRS